MKKRRGVYIDPLWVAFLMVGVAIGLLLYITGLPVPELLRQPVHLVTSQQHPRPGELVLLHNFRCLF